MKRATSNSPVAGNSPATGARIDTAKIEAIAERVAAPAGIEVVQVELKGSGRSHLLRVYIDKPEGVTHADCELVSREMSAILDVEDPIPGTYELEVSSPGVERPLLKWQDWERFTGKKVQVVLREPGTPALEGKESVRKSLEGVIARAENQSVTIEPDRGDPVTFPFAQVSRANLKFEW